MTLSRLLLIVALILFFLFGLWGAGWLITTEHAWAFLGFGLVASTAAKLLP